MASLGGRALRIRLVNGSGTTIKQMVVDDLLNANSQWVLQVVTEVQCDMGEWHHQTSVDLPCWPSRFLRP
jgi:hypothetical protein